MRSVFFSSLVLAAGALGLALATPARAQKDELVGPAIASSDTIPVAHWHGGWGGYGGWGGRGLYGWGGRGFYGGYYPRSGLYRGYYPGFYGGFRRYGYGGWGYPYGGFGAGPYSGFYGPGFYW